MQNTLVAVLGLAGFAMAQTTTFACNPAHEYPNGEKCISTAGSLTLVTPSATFACNPAHEYPNGEKCVSTAGSLTLITPSATTTPFLCNAAAIARGDCTATAAYVPSTTSTCTTSTASVTPTGYAATCEETYNSCRTAPDANMATCAAQYASCLGYNPFTTGSSASMTGYPTASTSSYVFCNAAALARGDCTAPPGVAATSTAATCQQTYDSCRVGADSNKATCAAQYAACLGYNPFTTTDSGSAATMSAPAATTSSYVFCNAAALARGDCTAPPGVAATSTAATCQQTYDSCRVAPNANMATCAAQYASCLGYNPFTNGGSASATAPYPTSYTTTAVMATGTMATVATGKGTATSATPAIFTGAANKATVGGIFGAAMAVAAML